MLFLVWCFTDKEECWQMIGPLGDVLGVMALTCINNTRLKGGL